MSGNQTLAVPQINTRQGRGWGSKRPQIRWHYLWMAPLIWASSLWLRYKIICGWNLSPHLSPFMPQLIRFIIVLYCNICLTWCSWGSPCPGLPSRSVDCALRSHPAHHTGSLHTTRPVQDGTDDLPGRSHRGGFKLEKDLWHLSQVEEFLFIETIGHDF